MSKAAKIDLLDYESAQANGVYILDNLATQKTLHFTENRQKLWWVWTTKWSKPTEAIELAKNEANFGLNMTKNFYLSVLGHTDIELDQDDQPSR